MTSTDLTSLTFPALRAARVWHFGTLCEADKAGRFGQSLEGHCLSVSQTPNAWRQIAKLGGMPLHALEAPADRGLFVDAHAVMDDPALLDAVRLAAVSRGLLTEKEAWLASRFDDEMDTRVSLVCHSRDAALAELEDDDEASVARVTVFQMTQTLQRVLGWSGALSLGDHTDLALLALIDDDCPHLDGLWWKDLLDPDSYSAPRGGILPSRLIHWTSRLETSHPSAIDDGFEPNDEGSDDPADNVSRLIACRVSVGGALNRFDRPGSDLAPKTEISPDPTASASRGFLPG